MQHEFDEDDQLGLLSLAEDQDERQRLEDDLLALEQYRSEIVRVGGITRAQAQALIQDYGLQMGGEPLQSFTVLPSQTNCAVAMESIAGTVLEKLGDLIKRGWEAFLKVIKWIVDKLSGLVQGYRNERDRARLFGQAVHSYNKMWQLAKTVKSGGTDLRANLGTTWLADKRFADHWSELTEQLAGSSLPNLYRTLSIDVLHLISVVELKVAAFEAAISKQPSTSADGDEIAATAQFRLIAEPVDASHTHGLLKAAGFAVNADDSIYDLMIAFEDRNRSQRRNMGSQHVDIEVLYTALGDPSHPYHQPLMVAPENVKSGMEKLSTRVRHVVSMNISDKMSHEHVTAFRKAQVVLQQEVSALRAYMTAVMFAEQHRYTVKMLIGEYGDAAAALVRDLAREDGIPEATRTELVKLLQEYRAARSEFTSRFGSFMGYRNS